jgi:hypothetical protein
MRRRNEALAVLLCLSFWAAVGAVALLCLSPEPEAQQAGVISLVVVAVPTCLLVLALLLRPPVERGLKALARRAQPALDRAADRVKDVLLDWGAEEDELPRPVARAPLLRLEPEVLVAGLRPQVEDALRRLADVLNEAPTLEAMAACEPEVRRVAAELARQAVERAGQARVDAAVAGLPPPSGKGAWAEKLRRMRAADGEGEPVSSSSAANWGNPGRP